MEEVKEEKAPLMVRLVEDFSLQSESEDDEDEEVVEIMTKIITTAQPPADIISPMSTEDSLEVKKEVAEEEKEVAVFNKEEKEVVVSNEEELLMDVKSKVDFLDTLCLQSVSSLRSTNLGVKEASASRRTLNQYHQVCFFTFVFFLNHNLIRYLFNTIVFLSARGVYYQFSVPPL